MQTSFFTVLIGLAAIILAIYYAVISSYISYTEQIGPSPPSSILNNRIKIDNSIKNHVHWQFFGSS